MISVLIDAAFRSLFVGLIVAVALRAFRIRNVFAQKAALGLVLIGALAMPVLMPVADRLQLLPVNASVVVGAHPMTLLQELQARLQARGSSGNALNPVAAAHPAPNPPQAEGSSAASAPGTSAPRPKGAELFGMQSVQNESAMDADGAQAALKTQPVAQSRPFALSLPSLLFPMYLAVAAILLFRLVLGLAVTLRLWLKASPISTHIHFDVPVGLRIRASSKVSSPLTIGSAILLPADYETWDEDKLRIVLAHERSHIRQCDFYLQLLAGLYAALVWFSPLGWWLKRELADLAEAISDRAGIEEAPSRASYAQILLEFAAAPRPTALGVAMARPGSLSRRIERLLNEHTFRQSFAGGRSRALFAFVLVPVVLFAATAMVQVRAATESGRVAWFEPTVRSAALLQASAADDRSRQPLPQSSETINLLSATNVDTSATLATSPDAENSEIATFQIASSEAAPNLLPVPAVPRAVAAQSESGNSLSFDRTLSVSGEAQLFVATGSGDIRLTHGAGSQIHIHGKIHVSREGSAEQAHQIAANPPIEQNGSMIRVGQEHQEHWHGISIDYDIEAPAGTVLTATSGSGDIVDDGVGKDAKLETGSGDIRANGLQGAFEVKTGSGNITAEQTGQGDVKAQTGSGDIEIKDIHGSFSGHTGSGDIKATGAPSGPWTLKTGSGNVEIWPGSAPLTLDASTGSGSVTTDHEMLVKGSLDHHHFTGNLNGGGPLVRVETGSGDVRVH